jgi:hypothetical protein
MKIVILGIVMVAILMLSFTPSAFAHHTDNHTKAQEKLCEQLPWLTQCQPPPVEHIPEPEVPQEPEETQPEPIKEQPKPALDLKYVFSITDRLKALEEIPEYDFDGDWNKWAGQANYRMSTAHYWSFLTSGIVWNDLTDGQKIWIALFMNGLVEVE